MNLGLLFKAEATLGILLVTRHPTPPIAVALLTAAAIVAGRTALPEDAGGVRLEWWCAALSVVQGAVVGSRLSARAALAMGRAAGAPPWALVVGRLCGAALMLLPVIFVQAAALARASALPSAITSAFGFAIIGASAAMALTPWLGSTAAAGSVAVAGGGSLSAGAALFEAFGPPGSSGSAVPGSGGLVPAPVIGALVVLAIVCAVAATRNRPAGLALSEPDSAARAAKAPGACSSSTR